MSADGDGRPWDWADGADDVIVAEQPPVACYINSADAIVLRQPAAAHDEDDAVIWFAPEHARAIAAAILYVAGYQASALAPEPAQVGGKAKDPTAAGRQARYRERQKNKPAPEPDIFEPGTVTGDVTPRDDRNGSCAA